MTTVDPNAGACTAGVCGTGFNNTSPKPGDPSNVQSISASTITGGIDVRWSYPAINTHSVAYYRLYRGATDDFSKAVELLLVNGTIYFDRIETKVNLTYFYWVQQVSINGTSGTVVGPATALARPVAEQTLESLSGMINKGVLANALKSDIDKIITLGVDLNGEIANRATANNALTLAMAGVQSSNNAAMTYILSEITERKSADAAHISAINALAVGIADNTAAIATETTLRVTADSALATSITTQVAALGTAVAAAAQSETTTRVNAEGALATQIGTVQSTLQGNITSVQTQSKADIKVVGDKVTEIGALYTVKVNVNGLAGGFGIYNNGQTVEAGFDVDTFWVGKTVGDKIKPFIINGGVVYIDKAIIRDADITTLKIAGNAVSIPNSVSATNEIGGNGSLITVLEDFVDMPVGGRIYASTNVGIGLGSGSQNLNMQLIIAGTGVALIGGNAETYGISLSGSLLVAPGNHKVEVKFQGADNRVRVTNRNLFTQGIKR